MRNRPVKVIDITSQKQNKTRKRTTRYFHDPGVRPVCRKRNAKEYFLFNANQH